MASGYKKHFATFTYPGFQRGMTVDIKDEDEAVMMALKQGAMAFRTHEAISVTIDGKEKRSPGQNYSGTRYVGIDRVFTRDQVLELIQAGPVGVSANAKAFNRAARAETKPYRSMDKDTVFIPDPQSPNNFLRLAYDEKVYNRQGKQVWPDPAKPQQTPKPRVSLGEKIIHTLRDFF